MWWHVPPTCSPCCPRKSTTVAITCLHAVSEEKMRRMRIMRRRVPMRASKSTESKRRMIRQPPLNNKIIIPTDMEDEIKLMKATKPSPTQPYATAPTDTSGYPITPQSECSRP